MSFGDVVSSNIVGYQTQGYEHDGYSISASSFAPVDGKLEATTLADIKPNSDFIYSQVCFIKKSGANDKVEFKGKEVSASYCYWAEGDGAAEGAGWYLSSDLDGEINQSATPLPFGDGFLVFRQSDEGSGTLTFSGAVHDKPVTKGFDHDGYTICGNCAPAPIKISDLTVNSDFIYSQVCFIKKSGANEKVEFKGKEVSASYCYWAEGDGAAQGAGWYLSSDLDGEINQNENVQLQAGEGFLVFRQSDEADAEITIPSAL